jgi:hypothetical protein
VRWDREANAASIEFTETTEPRRGMPVEDSDGNVVAVLRFAPDGELVELELLDAETQLPRTFRAQA